MAVNLNIGIQMKRKMKRKVAKYYIYDDFKMKQIFWFPRFIQKYFSIVRVKATQSLKKPNFLFSILDMAIICEHVHSQELWKSLKFWVAVAT